MVRWLWAPTAVPPEVWPVTLRAGRFAVRPLEVSDAGAWADARRRNADWLGPWEATVPPGLPPPPSSFRTLVRELRRQAREGRTLPFALTVDGEFAGQVTVSNIVGGSALFASIGYWVDQRFAGLGATPTGVALVIDHLFGAAGLHRVEIAVRPENSASLRVVEKLEVPEVGYARRYLHIDGDWRDHRLFALTVEERPEGVLRRLQAGGG